MTVEAVASWVRMIDKIKCLPADDVLMCTGAFAVYCRV